MHASLMLSGKFSISSVPKISIKFLHQDSRSH